MKRITNLLVMMMIGVLVSFPVKVFPVYAEGNSSDHQGVQSQDNNMRQGDNNDEQGDRENGDGQSNDEHDVFSLITTDLSKAPIITLPEINEKLILTYADVVVVIQSYQKAVSQISVAAGVDMGTANLTTGEKALLNELLNKHRNQFDNLNNRITEVNSQLKQLEDLLSPLGTQPISSLYGIKDLLISELNNFKDIISGVSEFDDLNLEVLQEETD